MAVFVDGALALAGDIEDFSQLNMAPDFSPARLPVAVDGRSVGVRRGLVVSLQEKDLRDAIVGKGTVLVQVEGLVEFGERSGQVALLLQKNGIQPFPDRITDFLRAETTP